MSLLPSDFSERGSQLSAPAASASGQTILTRLARLATRATGASMAVMLEKGPEHSRVAAAVGLANPIDTAVRALLLPLLGDPRWENQDHLLFGSGLGDGHDALAADLSESGLSCTTLAAAPVRRGGDVLGVMLVLDDEWRDWSEVDLEALRDVAALAGESLEDGAGAPIGTAPRQIPFRSLIENSADIVVTLSAGGGILYVTPSVEQVLGYRAESLVGQNIFAVTHPAEAERIMEGLAGLLRGRDCAETIECQVRHRSGGWRTFEVRIRNLLNDPAVGGIAVNARDVTDIRAAMQSQRRLNSFLEATPDFVAIFDPHGRAFSINTAFRAAVGIEADADISSMTVTDLFPPSVTERLMNDGIPTAVREGVWVGETRLERPDGSEIPISQVMLAHMSPEGSVEFLSTLARDVTQQKEAEAALRRSEAHFRSLIENALDMITVLDADGGILFASPSVRRTLGYEPEELLGTRVFDFVHPDDADRMRRGLADSVRTGERSPPIEIRLRHRDGSWRLLESVGESLLDDPAVAGVVINSRDVTERREAEEELHASREQLLQAQKMEAVGRLAGGVAHDFNNLLTAIKGFTELLLLDFDRRDPRYPFAQEIQAAANRAASLTRQLLAFSRKQVLQPQVIDLNASVVNMEKMLRRLIGEDVELVTVRSPDLERVEADPGQIEQILLNLVVNARDAMPSGGRLAITTHNETVSPEKAQLHPEVKPGPFVRLSVRDTGSGMSREVQNRIFEPFFTTKEQGRGTGLGLSTVYGIVQQSGGFVEVESRPEEGADFRVYLPAVARPAAPVHQAADDSPLRGGETVLLVEDEKAVRVLVRRVLDRMGYTVWEAEDGASALDLIRDREAIPDLLLTDVIMPGMSGRELADQIHKARPDLKVLFMSGYTDEAISQHGVLVPGVAFLEKPFTPEILLRRIRKVLDSEGSTKTQARSEVP